MANHKHPDTIDFLLVNVCHLHRIRVHQLLEELGLYQGQPMVLRELWDQEGQTQSELAVKLKVTAATMTKTLQRMEKAGFLRREPDADDQRVSRVYLTDNGRKVQDAVEEVFHTIEAETFANLTPEEMMLMRRLLLQLRENLRQVSGEDPWK